MADKHTPGPWSIWTSNSYRRIVSDTTRREVLCGIVQRSDGHPDLHFPNGGHDGPDARLIAAAPELLEAGTEFSALYSRLWDMVDGSGYLSPESIKAYDSAHEKLRAAIAKARGAA